MIITAFRSALPTIGQSLLTALLVAATAPAVFAQTDPLAVTGVADPRAASALREVTVIASDPVAARRFYANAAGMTAGAPRTVAAAEMARLGIPRPGSAVEFTRAVPGAANVRVIAVHGALAPLRPDHVALTLGGLAMGMPVSSQAVTEQRVTRAGFASVVGPTTMTLARTDGSKYTVGEIHYRAPDGVLVLGIDRGVMPPVGPIERSSGIGGPAYASIVVQDLAGSESFMRDVLRFEKRRDTVFTSSGPRGGLGLADGQRFAFQQWFAPGAVTGYVILLKMLDRPATPTVPRAPHSGLAMLGFTAANLAAVEARARAGGFRIAARPTRTFHSLIVEMPDGFPMEIAARSAGATR